MTIPGPGMLRFLNGVRREGFLDHAGTLWRQHGDLVRISTGLGALVIAVHPDAVDHVNVAHRQKYDKRKSYDGVRKYLTGEGLVASTGDLWRKQRKLLAPFYTPKGVQAYAELMLRDAERLVHRWDELAARGEELDVPEEMAQVTASIILRAMFSSESLRSIHEMKSAVETMITFVTRRMTNPLIEWLPSGLRRDYFAARTLVHRFIGDLIAERRRTPEERWPDDLLSRLMRTRDEETGAPMSEALLRDESITTFFAGHETTARTMSFTWYALAGNPGVAQRLYDELDGVLGGRTPTVEDLKRLPYTLQVVKEVLRLYPAAPFYVRDAIEDDVIGGHTIRAGTAVMLTPYYTHRHPDFWERPEVFDPDRFSREREASRHGHAYHPFATGPRICIGNNFSLLESHLLLAVLAQRFRLTMRPGFAPKIVMQGTLGTQNGLPMRIERRSPGAPLRTAAA